MKELSLNILDIAKNSVKAGATRIGIRVDENISDNTLTIVISDNGCGMSEEFVSRVRDPFTTTRTTRKVGMGIPLFELAASQCGGGLDIKSKQGEGTVVTARFEYDHIDRAPIGDMPGTLTTLISGSPNIDFDYSHIIDGRTFTFDTAEIREILGGVPLDAADVLTWINGYISEGLDGIREPEN